jgi:signal peptidase I
MRPTLHEGDRLLLRPFSGGRTPGRFQLVVGRFAVGGPRVVKRVIGLPGDRVRVSTGADGVVAVAVQPAASGPWLRVANPAWAGQWPSRPTSCCLPDGRSAADPTPQLVPAGMLFLLGDDPVGSADSLSLGWAPVRLVSGVVSWRVYPPSEVGRVGGHVTLSPVA